MKYEKPLLTKRETDIVILICKEYSNKQIAGELKISIYTLETPAILGIFQL
jgi:ATP/maltotriose-dependent transcriptional regulator MalT